MLRMRNVQPSLWESVLPEVCLRLPAELARVDEWLDDDRFLAPFKAHFDPRLGRPSVPMQTYLRLMFLRHRYRLGYETLCAEVADSISWRRFCHIDIDGRVPHPTTLMKTPPGVGTRRSPPSTRRCWPKRRAQAGEKGKSPRRHHRGVG
jgi:transposase, IS5 family